VCCGGSFEGSLAAQVVLALPERTPGLNVHPQLCAIRTQVALGEGGVPPHPVAPGNASEEVGSGVINIFTRESVPAFETSISTPVITPNGDGANESASISVSGAPSRSESGASARACTSRSAGIAPRYSP